MKKNNWITITIILIVIILAFIAINRSHPDTTEDIAKCIGENAELYVQLGCPACKTQENIFGEDYEKLNVIDCFYEREKCIEKKIEVTPTWIIQEEQFKGIKSIDQLKELTGC